MRLAAILLLSAGSIFAAGDPADTHPDLHLIPWPKSVQAGSGRMTLTAESRIVIADESLRPLAKVWSAEVAKLTGLKLAVAARPGRAGDIVLNLDPALKAGESILMLRNREPVRTTDGAHTIAIGEQAVVTGFDYRATAEGTATLLQLLRKDDDAYSLPRLQIKDWPHADYCGVMLDVGRQDHPIEAIKKVVEICRFYKARYLQLHLTDDQGWTFPST
jgi:N-acetyl-beta-hexosaminidase